MTHHKTVTFDLTTYTFDSYLVRANQHLSEKRATITFDLSNWKSVLLPTNQDKRPIIKKGKVQICQANQPRSAFYHKREAPPTLPTLLTRCTNT